MIKEFIIYKTEKEAKDAIAALDKINGYPVKGNTTQTTARVDAIGAEYGVEKFVFSGKIDASKEVEKQVEIKLVSTTLTKQVKPPKI